MSILKTIVDYKKEELLETKRKAPLATLKVKLISKDFHWYKPDMPQAHKESNKFLETLYKEGLQLIAEVKPASPSKGVLRKHCNPNEIAHIYAENGAAAISVLTEKRFYGGSLEALISIRKSINLPLLRKDFIFDPYQLYEAKIAGADAVLLIAAILSKGHMDDLYGEACELSLAVLPEVHNDKELEQVLSLDLPVVGINNRDLKTMETNIETTINMISNVPKHKIVVSESGIKSRNDVKSLSKAGVSAILVGETLMTAENIADKLKELLLK